MKAFLWLPAALVLVVVVKLVLLLMFLVYYNYYVLNLGGIIGRIKSIIGSLHIQSTKKL